MFNYWSKLGKTRIGGPARPIYYEDFMPGRYIKKGITFTTRGCNFNCPWCLVPRMEGTFRELHHIEPGNIIQDNNILLSSKKHLNKVFDMLRKEKSIRFKGGFDCRLLRDWHIEQLRNLKIKELWLALDYENRFEVFQNACEKLAKAGFTKDQLRCYVLAGYKESIFRAEVRLKFAYKCGTLPFIQPYRNSKSNKDEYSDEEKDFIRNWSRPAIIKSMMKANK